MKSKKLYTFLTLLFIFYSTYSQQRPEILFYDFESSESLNRLHFESDSTNIWQIGKPNKSLFKDSYSGQNVIITDTINPYPPNNKSSFWITLYKDDYYQVAYLMLDFCHFFYTDTLIDSAFVDFSYDGGKNWHIGKDQDSIFSNTDFSRYYIRDRVSYGINNPVVSGNYGGWVEESYFWAWYDPVKTVHELFYPDSIIIRFNFISDSIDTKKDGWMIDDIRIRIQGPGGTEISKFSEILLYPNPANNFIVLKSKKLISHVKIFSLSGKILYIEEIKTKNYSLNIEDLIPGIYFIEIHTLDGSKEFYKFLKY